VRANASDPRLGLYVLELGDGEAQVEVLERLTAQYKSAGPDAQEIFLLNILPDLVDQITSTVQGIEVDKITVIDNGGGASSGGGLPGVASQMPAAVIAVTEQIEAATGVNILSVLQKDGKAGHAIDVEEADGSAGGPSESSTW